MWARFASMCDSGPCHASLCCRSVDGHPLPIDELKGIKPVESIDLSGKGLNIASAIIIGACIAGNAHLRELKCAQLFKLGGSVTAGSVTLLKPLNVCLLPFAFSLADNNLTNNGKDMSGVKALAAALKDSQITNLK